MNILSPKFISARWIALYLTPSILKHTAEFHLFLNNRYLTGSSRKAVYHHCHFKIRAFPNWTGISAILLFYSKVRVPVITMRELYSQGWQIKVIWGPFSILHCSEKRYVSVKKIFVIVSIMEVQYRKKELKRRPPTESSENILRSTKQLPQSQKSQESKSQS